MGAAEPCSHSEWIAWAKGGAKGVEAYRNRTRYCDYEPEDSIHFDIDVTNAEAFQSPTDPEKTDIFESPIDPDKAFQSMLQQESFNRQTRSLLPTQRRK